MNNYFISFGQIHAHRVNGKTFDCDCLACIKAEDMESARQLAFDYFEGRWFTCYPEDQIEDILHYFPRGIINVNET